MTIQRFFTVVLGLAVAIAVGCGGGGDDAPSAPPAGNGPEPAEEDGAEPGPADGAADEKAAPAEEEQAEADVAAMEGWGHLKGKFIYDGSPPEPSPVEVTKDQEFCGEFDLVNESLVVDSSTGGLANVLVSLYIGRGDDDPEVHASYEETANDKVELDNKNCRFEPHIRLIRTSQTLEVLNSDEVGHNTKLETSRNPSFNQTIPAGGAIEEEFSSAERSPAPVSCSIHPWMSGWVVIQENPYFAVSNETGEFEIKNLPAGEWTFQLWQEKAGYLSDVTVDGEPAQWSRGRVEMTIKPDETTDLGEIKVSPDAFEN